mgnify:CR=1 FL=1
MKEKEMENKNVKLIDFESNLPHIVTEVICIRCKKRWISTRPTVVLLKELQCPKCKKKGFVIETGQCLEG